MEIDTNGTIEKEKGNAAFAKKDYALAIQHYTNAINLEPSNYGISHSNFSYSQ